MNSLFASYLLTAFVLTLGLPAAQAAPEPAIPVSTATGEALYSRFLGRWKGSLEYRDYSTNKRVTLPTLLDVSLSPDRKAMIWQFTYDDGPGKIVKGAERITIQPNANTWTEVEVEIKQGNTFSEVGGTQVYQLSNLNSLLQSARAVLLATGVGEESSKPVDVRKTLTVESDRFVLLKETRLQGMPFQFRNQYTFARNSANP